MARQARYAVQKAPGIGGAPIPDDEPCIVIRAQDRLALAVSGLGDRRAEGAP